MNTKNKIKRVNNEAQFQFDAGVRRLADEDGKLELQHCYKLFFIRYLNILWPVETFTFNKGIFMKI